MWKILYNLVAQITIYHFEYNNFNDKGSGLKDSFLNLPDEINYNKI
jgi:hypothetical protein